MARFGKWLSIELPGREQAVLATRQETEDEEDAREVRAMPLGNPAGNAPYQRWVAGDAGVDTDKVLWDAVDRHWALQRCLSIRAESLSSLPVRCYKHLGGDEYEELPPDHPLPELLGHVNDTWSMPMLISQTEMALCTSQVGAFWVMDRWVEGEPTYPTELWWASSSRLVPMRGKRGEAYVKAYEDVAAKAKAEKVVPTERVVWFRQPTPGREFGNLAPALSAIAPATLALSALKANESIFDQGMTGAGIVSPREGVVWSLDTMKEIGAVLRDTLKGRRGWHRLAMLTRGDYRIEKLSMSPADAQFVDLLAMTNSQVCQALGVPLPLIEPTDSTFSNSGEARGILWSNTLLPRAVLMGSAIKRQLGDVWFPGEADLVELDTSTVPELAESAHAAWQLRALKQQAIVELLTAVAAGQATPRQATMIAVKFLDIDADDAEALFANASPGAAPKIVGGVAVPPGSSGGGGIVPAGPKLAPPPQLALPGRAGRSKSQHARRAADPLQVGGRSTAVLAYGSPEHIAWERARSKDEEGMDRELRRSMSALYGRHADDALDGLRGRRAEWDRYVRDSQARWGTKLSGDVDGSVFETQTRSLVGGGRLADWASDGARSLEVGLASTTEQVRSAKYLSRYGLAGVATPDSAAAALIAERAAWFGPTVAGSGARMIGRSVLESAIEGLAPVDAEERLQLLLEGWVTERAELTALNEFHWFSQAVSTSWARGAGIGSRTWYTAIDKRVRPTHRAAHGQTVGLSEPFLIDGKPCSFPGSCEDASENIGCRCVQNFSMA